MADAIHVEIVSKERKVFEELNASMVVIPASEGEMGVLPNHAPTLTTLGYGELIVRKGNAEERFVIYGGVVDVRPGKVTVLAELAESSFDLDLEAIEAARDRAQKMMQEGVPATINREATLALRRAEIAMKVNQKVRQRGPVMRIVNQEER
ncbi:MAG TPA: ATP synthase F1 subunit epsilon [Phototrophicaceae bacterium]|jgi:F-type H+-transporting ATPase subunit epsilon|nr:ATP synthase F1 subunit epsilon [Phototrophicaceae bacterium]